MSPRQWTALALVLGLLAGTAMLLRRVGAQHRLGKPGLKLVAEPTFIEGGLVAQTNSVFLPSTVLDFTSRPQEVSSLEVNWLPKDTLFGRRTYRAADGFTALASVVLMGTDRTSIHKPQYCLDGQGWRIEKSETAAIPISRPHPYELRVMKLTTFPRQIADDNGQPMMVRGIYIYWFVADNELTPYHGERMWWMARDLIRTGVLQRWAYVSYFIGCTPGQEDPAFNRLKQLIAASVPEFQLASGPRYPVGSTAAVSTDGYAQQKN
jgi:Protein of unknown function (DUF3485)